jgi:mono/diheme cytochrome c family protein
MPTETAGLTAALVALSLSTGFARAGDLPRDPPRDPERIYAISCHFCHDNGIGKALKGAQLDPQRIRLAVRQGYVAMPAFAPSFITDAELEALVQMLSQAPAPAPSAGTPP